ncbi:MAG: S1 family peptidase [Pollutimonas bauzanensis]
MAGKPRHQAGPSGPDVHATGIFLNAGGDVLTARHAVRDCSAVYVVKDARVVAARIRAISQDHDLAVLSTALKPYLSATFPATAQAQSQGVFAESYAVVQRMSNRASVVFNGLSEPDKGELSLLSPVQPGASGSPVLGGGLVLGVVVERVATGQISPGSTTLSQLGRSMDLQGVSRVKAVSTEHVKDFLRSSAIAFTESDEPQLGRMQAQAPRAATLSVGVICG